MALNQFMHPRNRYKDNKPEFTKLAEKYPEFARHLSINLAGNASLDFHDPESLRALTCTLLKEDFGLSIELPLDRLIPTIPLRLNYIHWIEDLLQQSGHNADIYGIDIGCGASCIYPLLGCQMNGWQFAASEIDDLALQYACDNVKKNNLENHIKVLAPPKDTLIQGIFKAVPQSLYHFTMCNPPFFGNMLEAQGIMSSRSMSRPEPKSVSTASEVEMIYEEGGEVDFVKRMIAESRQLREQVVWYTSMLGKKSSLGPLKEELRTHKIRNFTTTEFCQGRTMRWGIAWTFHDDITVPPPSKRRKFKQRPPLVIPVPDCFVEKAATSGSTSSNTTRGHTEKVQAVAGAVKQMMKDLQISFAVQPSSRKSIKLECTAVTNTWANQRRKRRQRHKEQVATATTSTMAEGKVKSNVRNAPSSAVPAGAVSDSGSPAQSTSQLKGQVTTSSTMSEGEVDLNVRSEPTSAVSERAVLDGVSKVQSMSQEMRPGQDVKDLPQSKPGDSEVLIKSEQTPKDISSSSITKDHHMTGEDLQTTPFETKSDDNSGINRLEQNQNDFPLSSATKEHPEIGSCLPSTSVEAKGDTSCEENQSEQYPKDMPAAATDNQESGEGLQKKSIESKDGSEPLFKCTLFVKIVDEKVVVEMSWLDGSSRESMHQVGQYIKNQFAK
ncbi:RNA N(6)-adenosine-methyltransferase mettl16-like [Amphiura filiformis]|uniref:RNA N(6)-adenosine-methyltransferase mettl16-like n=1 Tax=Amphiura filiformis TaxID=82378 RepID=UPI003B222070